MKLYLKKVVRMSNPNNGIKKHKSKSYHSLFLITLSVFLSFILGRVTPCVLIELTLYLRAPTEHLVHRLVTSESRAG